jgi:hypothetical protein
MYMPATRERVRLRNFPGVYFVLLVDSDAKEADLLRLDQPQPRVKEGIPFHDILPIMNRVDPPDTP